MRESVNPFEKIVSHYAEQLGGAPGARKLARLASSVKRIPEPLVNDVATLIAQLGDADLVADVIAVRLLDLGYCDDTHYGDAAEFVSALGEQLRRHVDDPDAASAARAELREQLAWWRTALGRASELRRSTAGILMEMCGG